MAAPDVAREHFAGNGAPIAEILRAECADLLARFDAMTAEATALPGTIGDEETMTSVATVIARARALAKEADGTRAEAGKPLLDAKRELDAFFKAATARLDAAMEPHVENVDAHARRVQAEAEAKARREREEAERAVEEARQRAEEASDAASAAMAAGDLAAAEARAASAGRREKGSPIRGEGVSVGRRTRIVGEIEDYAKLNLNALRHFFRRADVEHAVREAVKAQGEGCTIRGVRVVRETRANVRA